MRHKEEEGGSSTNVINTQGSFEPPLSSDRSSSSESYRSRNPNEVDE
jgi:hypothetical protein